MDTEEKCLLIKDILKNIDVSLKKGVDLIILKEAIRKHIDKKSNKKRTKKKKICRPALFISDSSDNE